MSTAITRPLAIIDVETTGTDPASDRIITMAVLIIQPDGAEQIYDYIFNPGRPIPPEATEVHGITDAAVKDKPPFRERAEMICQGLKGCDLAGFCLLDFDVPLLWEEFHRAGIAWDLTGVRIIDAGVIFKVKEERTLSAAVKFYCGREHDGAHGAKADVLATHQVLTRQLAHYALTDDRDQLAALCKRDDRIDLAGKIVRGKDGRPVYAIGKAKGVAVMDDQGFGHWMLRNGFSEETKMQLRKILNVH